MITTFKLRSTISLKAGALSIATLAAVLLVPAAHAQVLQLTSPSMLSPQDITATFTGNQPDNFSSPYILPVSSDGTLTFTNNNSFQRQNQGGPGSGGGLFAGDFTPGTPLLRNAGIGSGTAGGVTINFSNPLDELGFNFDPTAGTVDFTFNVFENGNTTTPALTFTTTATQFNSRGNNPAQAAQFFGAKDLGGNLITSITVSGVVSNVAGNPAVNGNDFAMSALKIGAIAAPVPEPGTLALLTGVSLPITLLTQRRRRRG